jgi:hypothetical protein
MTKTVLLNSLITNFTVFSYQTFLFIHFNLWAVFTACYMQVSHAAPGSPVWHAWTRAKNITHYHWAIQMKNTRKKTSVISTQCFTQTSFQKGQILLHNYILRTCQLWRHCQCYFQTCTRLWAKHVKSVVQSPECVRHI